MSDLINILPIGGGDKSRHYIRSFTEQVGVGFIPTRDLVCIDDECRQKSLILESKLGASPQLERWNSGILEFWVLG